MLKRYWFVIVALGLALPNYAQERTGVESPAIRDGSSDAVDIASEFEPPALPVVIVQTPEQESHASEREAKADEREAHDLAAQQEAADAADRGATAADRQIIPTWAQAGFAFVGTVLLVVTVIYTIRTHRHTVASSERQLRAYVGTTSCGIKPVELGGEIVAGITIKNFGHTPATITHVSSAIQIIDISPDLTEFPLYPDYDFNERRFALFMGDDTRTLETQKGEGVPRLTVPLMSGLSDGTVGIRFFGLVKYEDAFGKKHYTAFTKILTGKGTLISGEMRTDQFGNNEAT